MDHLFYVFGGALVAWALLLSLLGILSKDFPKTAALERAIGVVTVVLVGAAVGGAIADAVGEEPENKDEGEPSALLLPS